MLSNGGHYRRNNCDHYRNVGTLRKLAQERETGGGARLAAVIEATNSWKAKLDQVATVGSSRLLSPLWGTIGLWSLSPTLLEIGLGKLELAVEM